jgi:prevent-host-death family protein
METVNIHEAKTHLSRLVDQAAKGKPFVIAKAGKPLVKVTPLDAPTGTQVRRLGFLAGQFAVPEDFDQMGRKEIERMFGGQARTRRTRSSRVSGGGRSRGKQ